MGDRTGPTATDLEAAPGRRAHRAAEVLGAEELAAWCARLLTGAAQYGDAADPDVGWLAGRPVTSWGAPARVRGDTGYWARVWAARTLLHEWHPVAAPAVVAGLGDDAWRVREMCAKVAARGEVAEAVDGCAGLLADPVPRVRVAAARAIAVCGEAEHAAGLLELEKDPDPAVRAGAVRALGQLEARLDRSLRAD